MRSPLPPAAVAVALLVLASGCRGDTGDAPSAGPPAVSPHSATPSPTATSTPTSGPIAVPVYFVGPTPSGPRLFAELRTVDRRHAVDQALAALAEGPQDPDYTSYLRPGRLRMESYDENAVLVVPDAAWLTRPDGVSDQQARLALQQVVLTVQAALGKRIPAGFVTADHVALGDGFYGLTPPPDQTGYVATRGLALMGRVNVLSPAQGQTVSGSFTASGLEASFEGTVGWRVLDAAGHTALVYSCQARRTYVRRLAPWRCAIDVSSLDPGDYTFVARTDTGSLEGPRPTKDTRSITVS